MHLDSPLYRCAMAQAKNTGVTGAPFENKKSQCYLLVYVCLRAKEMEVTDAQWVIVNL